MPDEGATEQLVADNPFLPYLNFFRFTLLLGDILEDFHSVKPMDEERVAIRDRELVDWQDSWPPDLNLGEYGIASALSSGTTEDVRRRGVQCMYLIGSYSLRFFRQVSTANLGLQVYSISFASCLIGHSLTYQ